MMGKDMSDRLAQLHGRAAASGLRMTPQRLVLLRALSQTRTHPTADELFRQVQRQLPNVSQATVYRNLQELVRAHLIATLERAGSAVRYDANPDDHHHFVCRSCGGVSDIYLKDVAYAVDASRSAAAPSSIERAELQLHGVCSTCAVRRGPAAGRRRS
ncbi:MAG: Fur family transcriptional regulator [Acidobacteriota bacterium]